jgi:hypothetical protein
MKNDAGFDYALMWRVLAYALAAAALGPPACFHKVGLPYTRTHDHAKPGAFNGPPRAEVEAREAEEDEEE